tara:strand:- start:5289 stop:5909 length:621 start_codon:yes stop_codon:yes gene_type:complete
MNGMRSGSVNSSRHSGQNWTTKQKKKHGGNNDMNPHENDRKILNRKMSKFHTGRKPEGYGYADRPISIGEEVYIYQDQEWVKVTARSAHDWWATSERHNGAPDNMLGGFSFNDPRTGKLNYYCSLRVKEEWNGEEHIVIGLHDPNPYVCIKTDGNNPVELDSKGLPYYPITLPMLRKAAGHYIPAVPADSNRRQHAKENKKHGGTQ